VLQCAAVCNAFSVSFTQTNLKTSEAQLSEGQTKVSDLEAQNNTIQQNLQRLMGVHEQLKVSLEEKKIKMTDTFKEYVVYPLFRCIAGYERSPIIGSYRKLQAESSLKIVFLCLSRFFHTHIPALDFLHALTGLKTCAINFRARERRRNMQSKTSQTWSAQEMSTCHCSASSRSIST